MQYLLMFALLAVACSDVPESGPRRYDSVRERLSDVSASLYVHDEASSGALSARLRGQADWLADRTPLAVDHGYVRASIDDSERLAITHFEIALAPVRIGDVFGRTAELRDVQLQLVEPVRGAVVWISDDDATATLIMRCDVGWAIAFDGGKSMPMPTQHLAPQEVQVTLGGSGEHVEASFAIDAAGQLWSWANSVDMTELVLVVNAATSD
jgi:hypothetical protein